MIASASVYSKVGTIVAYCVVPTVAAFSTAAWAQVGYVHEIVCALSIERPPSKLMAAKVGDMFGPDTIFRTGINGKTILRFADGQIVVLGADTTFRVGQYRFDSNNIGQSSSAVTLSKGEMRFVTGAVGDDHRDGVRIDAGISKISILKPGGADFTVMIDPDPRDVGFAAVAFGEIGGRTPYGVIDKVTPSQYIPWQPGRTLMFPTPVAAAPAVIQAATMGLFATVVPANTPVNVASAADAARLVALPDTIACPTQAKVVPGAGENAIADLLAGAGPNGSRFPVAPIPPPVTPGSGGACTGSVC
jgi:hypothetical protein